MSPEQTECVVYIARAFCRDHLGGNLAGVVLEQGFITAQMQAIAKNLNFSETAFLLKIGPTLYKILYFTPNSSIDFCGHATIAAFGVLMPSDVHTLLFKQGDQLNAPSNIYVRYKNKRIEKVECGGEVIIDEMRTLQLE